jgi:hypothetical protein
MCARKGRLVWQWDSWRKHLPKMISTQLQEHSSLELLPLVKNSHTCFISNLRAE